MLRSRMILTMHRLDGIRRSRLVGALLLFPALSHAQAQTWAGCAENRESALMLAQSAMVQDVGDREVSGSENLKNKNYTADIHENAEMVTDKPVTVLNEYKKDGKVCVEIAP